VDNELQFLWAILKKATRPEEVFGILVGTVDERLLQCTKSYRHIVGLAHPDHFSSDEDKAKATETFKLLQPLYEQAQAKIKSGTYGDHSSGKPIEPVNITSKKNNYPLGEMRYSGSISDLFMSSMVNGSETEHLLIKVARNYKNNEFIKNEATNLKTIFKDPGSLLALLPECLDSFSIQEPTDKSIRQANVFHYQPDLVSMETVIEKYSKGIDPRDMAWMFKRILAALFCAHEKGIIHGAVLPPHILLNLKNHGILLIDWAFSVGLEASHIKAIDSKYKEYYPKAVFEKKPPMPASDIYMTAMSMVKLLGGELKTKTIPDTVPKSIRMLLRACTLDPSGLDNAFEVHEEFKKTIGKLFGPPKFREFKI